MATNGVDERGPDEHRPELWRDPLLVLWLILPAAVWASHGFQAALGRDGALYVYAGQAVADGDPPYVAVMNRAGPLAHLLPGLGVTLGRWAGIGDVLGVRALYFVLIAVVPLLVYVATRITYTSRLAGCVAAAAMVSYQGLAQLSTVDPDSKLPMVTLFTIALILLLQRKMLLGGVASGLATLCWQPALLTAVSCALVMGLSAEGGHPRRAMALGRFAVGGLATLGAAVAYFAAVGAVGSFVDGFWRANTYTVQRGLFDKVGLWDYLLDWYGWTIGLVILGCVLSVALAVWAWRRPGDEPSATLLRHRTLALAVVVCCALVWSVFAFQGGRDALLLLPPASISLGGAVAAAGPLLAGHRRAAIAVVACWVVLTSAATAAFLVMDRSDDLRDEEAAASAVFTALPPDVTVMADQAPQPLALAGRRSISRYTLFTNGMLGWIDADTPGGVDAFVGRVHAAEPAVLFTDDHISAFLKPLRPDYVCVGVRPDWMVWLHRDLDPTLRDEVASAMSSVGTGDLQPEDGEAVHPSRERCIAGLPDSG